MAESATQKRKRDYTCFCVPRVSTAARQVIESFGLMGSIQISAFELALVPFDDDVASLALAPGIMVSVCCDLRFSNNVTPLRVEQQLLHALVSCSN